MDYSFVVASLIYSIDDVAFFPERAIVDVAVDAGFDQSTGILTQRPHPQYRTGGKIAEIFFLPAHQLDRLARPETWADRSRAPFF